MAASIIARPAGVIRPSASSRTTRSLLVRAQPLPDLRRVNQSIDRSSSSLRPDESIQPTQSASSTDARTHRRPAGRRLPRHQPRAGLGRVVGAAASRATPRPSPRAPAGRRPCLPCVLLVVVVVGRPRRRAAAAESRARSARCELAFRRRDLALVGAQGLLRGADLLVRDRGGLAGGGEPAAGLRELADQVVLLLVRAGGGLLGPGDLGGALVAGGDRGVVPAPAPRSPRGRPSPTRPGPRRAPAARAPRGGVDGRAPRRTRRSARPARDVAARSRSFPRAGGRRRPASPWAATAAALRRAALSDDVRAAEPRVLARGGQPAGHHVAGDGRVGQRGGEGGVELLHDGVADLLAGRLRELAGAGDQRADQLTALLRQLAQGGAVEGLLGLAQTLAERDDLPGEVGVVAHQEVDQPGGDRGLAQLTDGRRPARGPCPRGRP